MKEIIENIAKAAEQAIPENEGDYRNDDGFLMCGKCHTPKQCKVEFLGVEKIVKCLCRCASEAHEKERAEFFSEMQKRRIERYRSIGIKDKKLLEFTFANDDKRNVPISDLTRRYVNKFSELRKENYGLLLWGEPGTGKSFYAGCIGNALIDKGYPVFATTINRLINQMFSIENKNEFIKELCRFELLIIDDIGSERNTSYANEQVFTIIDERYKSNKPTIVTTNLDPKNFQSESDMALKRTYSRLLEMCVPVEVKGERRTEAGKKKIENLRKLLYSDD